MCLFISPTHPSSSLLHTAPTHYRLKELCDVSTRFINIVFSSSANPHAPNISYGNLLSQSYGQAGFQEIANAERSMTAVRVTFFTISAEVALKSTVNLYGALGECSYNGADFFVSGGGLSGE